MAIKLKQMADTLGARETSLLHSMGQLQTEGVCMHYAHIYLVLTSVAIALELVTIKTANYLASYSVNHLFIR